ncbi:hypothetical protein [Luteitalea sp.]
MPSDRPTISRAHASIRRRGEVRVCRCG